MPLLESHYEGPKYAIYGITKLWTIPYGATPYVCLLQLRAHLASLPVAELSTLPARELPQDVLIDLRTSQAGLLPTLVCALCGLGLSPAFTIRSQAGISS